MKFAIKNENRIKAEVSGEIAQCICCGSLVRAYIKDHEREVRLRNFNNQWKHIKKKMCDNWWENETAWHRNWKNNFPAAWQEFVKFDILTGEKHIADIFTIGRKEEIIIEFQNSKISEREVKSREEFYKKMIWVVNAQNFGITLGSCVDRENKDTELLDGYLNLRTFIISFYDEYSGEANSYKDRTVPIEHIDFNNCISAIEWYSRNYVRNDEKFREDFEKFKAAIIEYPIFQKRITEYKNRIKEIGYFYYECNNGSNFWRIATAPVFFDFDGDLYKVIQDCDNVVNSTDDDDEWDDDELDYFDGFSDSGIVKRYSHMQFVNHYEK